MVAHITLSMGNNQDDLIRKGTFQKSNQNSGGRSSLFVPPQEKNLACRRCSQDDKTHRGVVRWTEPHLQGPRGFFWASHRKCVTHPYLKSLATLSSAANEAALARGEPLFWGEKHLSPPCSLSPLCSSVIGGLLASCLERGSTVTPSPPSLLPCPTPRQDGGSSCCFSSRRRGLKKKRRKDGSRLDKDGCLYPGSVIVISFFPFFPLFSAATADAWHASTHSSSAPHSCLLCRNRRNTRDKEGRNKGWHR